MRLTSLSCSSCFSSLKTSLRKSLFIMYSGGRYSCTAKEGWSGGCALTVVAEVADEVAFAGKAAEEFVGHVVALFASEELRLLLLVLHYK